MMQPTLNLVEGNVRAPEPGRPTGMFFRDGERQARLQASALSWLGVRFRDFGRTRQGVDCIGCALGMYRGAGFKVEIAIPRYTMDGGHHRNDSPLVQAVSASPQFAPAPASEPAMIGDLLCFRFGRQPWHVGVMVRPCHFIHVYRDAGKVVESSLHDTTWKKRLTHIFRPIFHHEGTEGHGG